MSDDVAVSKILQLVEQAAGIELSTEENGQKVLRHLKEAAKECDNLE